MYTKSLENIQSLIYRVSS